MSGSVKCKRTKQQPTSSCMYGVSDNVHVKVQNNEGSLHSTIKLSDCIHGQKEKKKQQQTVMPFTATEVSFSLPLLIYQTFKGFLVTVKDGAVNSYE